MSPDPRMKPNMKALVLLAAVAGILGFSLSTWHARFLDARKDKAMAISAEALRSLKSDALNALPVEGFSDDAFEHLRKLILSLPNREEASVTNSFAQVFGNPTVVVIVARAGATEFVIELYFYDNVCLKVTASYRPDDTEDVRSLSLSLFMNTPEKLQSRPFPLWCRQLNSRIVHSKFPHDVCILRRSGDASPG
jgi:hypothetical protein